LPFPESARDVSAVVRWARERGLRVAPQGTGHNAIPLGSLAHTVLLKTERMRGVSIDVRKRRARVDAGVLWAEVTDAAADYGLAALAGSSPDVGVVGYTLGGGVSWLGRRYGLAANSVTAVELVNAQGDLVHADAEQNADLFWALRGGGGSFGVVTAIEFELYPVTDVYAGVLFFPLERAQRSCVRGAAGSTRAGRSHVGGPLPAVPADPRDPGAAARRLFVIVEAVSLLGPDATDELLRPLRDLGPQMDTFATIPAASSSACTWIRSIRSLGLATARCSRTSTMRRSTRSCRRPAPVRARRCSASRSGTPAVRSPARRQGRERWRRSTGSSCCSPSGWR
jgi:FAD/FMN-containing dehydrogenase